MHQSRLCKTRIIDFAERDEIVYLDCDTEVHGDLSEVFRAMSETDFACTINDTWQKEPAGLNGSNLSRICPLNAGVTYFRVNPRTHAFFARWHRLYQERGMGRDQPNFTVSVLSDPDVRFMPLHWSWNAFPSLLRGRGLKAETHAMVHHYRHLSEDRAIARWVLAIHERTLGLDLPDDDPIRSAAHAFECYAEVLRARPFWYVKDDPRLLAIYARLSRHLLDVFRHLVNR